MSHTRVKTTYQTEGEYASTETHTLYCHHNHSCDYVIFYDDAEERSVVSMVFQSWIPGNDLQDAMDRLWFPFKKDWGGELKDNVEYYTPPVNERGNKNTNT